MKEAGQQSAISNKPEQSSDSTRLPASRKIYVEPNGSASNQNRHKLRIPFREIALSPSKDFDGNLEENAPVRVYDTSGVWTDPDTKCDVREGLPALLSEISTQIRPERELLELRIPHEEAAAIARLHKVGQVLERRYLAKTTKFKARIPPHHHAEFAAFIVE